jgi:hypothetical protein
MPKESLEDRMCVPGEEMERMDVEVLAVDIISRWASGDQDGMAGMPSGWVCPFSARAVR